jgi:hypothetical protein
MRTIIYTWALVLALSLGSTGVASAAPSAAAVAQASKEHGEPAQTGERPVLLIEMDTSPSTKWVLRDMKVVGKRLAEAAPAGTRVGVVGFDSQTVRKLFEDRAEAAKFIDSFSPGGTASDFGRAVDAGLALLQEASATRAAVVFVTDGSLDLPSRFRDRSGLAQILAREYGQRPYTTVFVINVGAGKLAGTDTLPQNVVVISLENWQAAQEEIERSLAPKIKEQLAAGPTVTTTPKAAPAASPAVPVGSYGKLVATAAVLGAAALLLALLLRRRRRSPTPAHRDDLLREEDVRPEPTVAAAPVAVMEFSEAGGRVALHPTRHVLRRGEKVVVGGSSFASGLTLPGLTQSRTVEFAFDGAEVACVRLRPDRPGAVDPVSLNGDDAPATFALGRGDDLRVGGHSARALMTDEENVSFVDTFGGTQPRTIPPKITAQGPPEGRRLRRGGLRAQE